MDYPKTFKSVLSIFNSMPEDIKYHYQHLPKLIETFPYEVSLAYMFYRLELAFNMTMYCCVVKLFSSNPELTWIGVQNTHFTRESFQEYFQKILNEEMESELVKQQRSAEKTRDKVIHGKSVSDAEQRKAIVDLLNFSNGYNNQVARLSGLRPMGKLQGFKGNSKSLDKNKSRWILKGIGFLIS